MERIVLSRPADWEARLDAFLADVASRGYEFGTCDCVLFGMDVAEVVTGFDFLAYAPFDRNRPKMELLAQFVALGGHEGILRRLQDEFIGSETLDNPMMAQKGDIVYHPKWAVFGVMGSDCPLYVTHNGLVKDVLTQDLTIIRLG